MIYILLDAELLEQQHTTDTEKYLLLQTVLPVTTVERVSNRLIELRVHLVVGIKQIKLNTTNISHPYRSMYLIVGVRNVNNQRISVIVINTLNGD